MDTALRLDRDCLAARFTQATLAGRAGDATQARQIVLTALEGLAVNPAMAKAAGLNSPPNHH
jgi:hypothetical protein